MSIATTSPIASLPPELLDQIIRENRTDAPTLHSCSFGDEQSDELQLSDVLVNSPHLRSHIRTFRISDASTDGWTSSWCEAITEIVALLDSVTSFGLFFQRDEYSPGWNDLPQDLRAAICWLCQRSPLVSLHLVHLGTFRKLEEFAPFVTSAALTELSLQGIVLPMPEDELRHWTTDLKLTSCRSILQISTLSVLIRWLVDGDSFSHVRYLHCPWNAETVEQLQHVIQASKSTLQTIFLYSHNPLVSHDDSNRLSLSSLELLRTLNLHLIASADQCERLPHMLAGLLGPCAQSLTTIHFGIFMVPSITIQVQMAFPAIDWTTLADTLTVARFPNLAKVKFDARSFVGPVENSAQTYIEGVRRAFPHLLALGILQCEVVH
ncbi:hypothetical protein B0H19DRAFT_1253759 [Mycena capillaripes]|nr:hypothetical protein B0H19DRAFT_1253759 [Mycena capillaripes]